MKFAAWLIGLIVLIITLYALDSYNKSLGNLYVVVLAFGFMLVSSDEFTAFFFHVRDLTGGSPGNSRSTDPSRVPDHR